METIENLLNEGVGLAPYNYELYRRFNPRLTREIYNFLRGNKRNCYWKHD